jgi:Lon protease-like protein
MFPLSTVLFPCQELPLHVFEPRYQALVQDCLAADGAFGVVLIERGSEVGGGDERCSVGTLAQIEAAAPLTDGRWVLGTRGRSRVAVTRWLPDDPYPSADVELLDDTVSVVPDLSATASAVRRARALLSELNGAPAVPPEAWRTIDAPDELLWTLCAQAPLTAYDRQRLLEQPDVATRLAMLDDLVTGCSADLERMLNSGPGDPSA